MKLGTSFNLRIRVELEAQQSREARPGQAPGQLAVVELEVLFLE
jgi:hypothetical protein